MLTHWRRLVSAGISAMLGVAFVAAALGIGDAMNATAQRDARAALGDAVAVVTPGEEVDGMYRPVTGKYVQDLRGVPGVTEVRPVIDTWVMQRTGRTTVGVAGRTLPEPDDAFTLTQGRRPTRPGEVAVNAAFVEHRGGHVGEELPLGTDARHSLVGRVVGVLTPMPGTDRRGEPAVYAANADLLAWAGRPATGEYDTVLLSATPGTDPETLRDQVAALSSRADAVVRTAADEVKARTAKMDHGSGIFTSLLLSFAAISVLVSALVIANTFAIVVAQQTRALALLRCVGATKRQVFRQVLRDASVTAAVSSLAGIALGTAVVAILSVVSRGKELELAGVTPTPLNLGVPLLVGFVVTLSAAVFPARRATRTAPLAALRTDVVSPDEASGRRLRRLSLGTGLGLVVAIVGTAVLVAGAATHQLPIGLLGGAASLTGLVMAGKFIVPALARVVGSPASRVAGLPGQLAVDNSRRNPARSAATASALVVGVTLITLMSVGAASGQASVEAEIDTQLPVDAVVAAPAGLPGAARSAVTRSTHVQAVTSLDELTVNLTSGGTTLESVQLTGFAPDAAAVVRSPALLDGVRDGVVVLDKHLGVRDGARVELHAGGRTVEATALVRHMQIPPVTTQATVQRLVSASARPQSQLWVRFADDADPIEATERLRSSLSEVPGAQVSGIASSRGELRQIVDMVLYVVTGLLGVAVVIALVGVGNTLGLSVLERTRETGLLRALGVTRRQVRGMLGIEALVLAGVGTTIGILAGIGYGIAGAHAMIGGVMDVATVIPWPRLALVAAVALLAGWGASVLPGRRAANVPPSAALAAD